MRRGFVTSSEELVEVGAECHRATRVMLWCGSVMVSL